MVRTRFAPSPTGFLHIGGVRTALYSYALARKHKGAFVLRIEDTDKKREIEGGIKNIVDGLKVFGMKFDEGPGIEGPYKPYIQSKRLKIYQEKAQELIDKGKAYYCFCSEERLKKLRESQQKAKKQPKYDGKCREIKKAEAEKRIKNGEKFVIRLKVPRGEKLILEDVLLGKVSWNSNDVDDQVLLKSDSFPTYHLAVVVDDVLMKISHITRGIEWLASVPKHILLYKAFDYKFPVTAHMPVILDPDGGKLSKRKGAVAVNEFLEQGYLPEATLNFLMLLGWAPKDDREFFSLSEFVKEFSMERLNKASPVFDRQKLLWFNGEYIRKLSKKGFEVKFLTWAKKYLKDKKLLKQLTDDEELVKKLELIQERVSVLSEIPNQLEFFYENMHAPNPKEIKGVKRYEKEDYVKVVSEYAEIIRSYEEDSSKWKHEKWEEDIRSLADKYSWKHGDMFMMIRLVICGSPVSPPLFESMVILGKDEIIRRLGEYK
ncbi:glutamate--tRNA ligase [Candidatus Dojkabacteria bacterium]|nr:glutamate--tRNA ligase [Candidatus Dojkabacteria bacterium]